MYQPKRHFNYPHPPCPPPPAPSPKKSDEHWFQLFCILDSPKNFTCPLGKSRTEFTSPIAKSTSPGFQTLLKLLFIIRSKGKKGTCSDQKNARWVSKSVSQQIKIFWAKWVNIFLSLKQGGNITRLINGGILNWLVTACHILEKILCKILFL